MSNLLFIDDEIDIIENYKEIFANKPSYTIYTASQGEEGLDTIKMQLEKEDPINVSFIDMRMPPGIDGMETVRRIRTFDSNIEIVLVTAYMDFRDNQNYDSLNMLDKLLYLKKPFDVQEMKQLALNLSIKYKNEMIKDTFIAEISHELKTPLSVVLGFYELLKMDENLSADSRESLNILGQSAHLMKRLVQDLLCMLQCQDDRLQLFKDKVDMIALVQDVFASFRTIEKDQENITFQCKIEHSGPLFLKIDRTRIIQSLNNLLCNAFKFTLAGHIDLILRTDETFIYLIVKDTGIGVEFCEQKKIFKRFVRLENFHHKLSGFGIGLAIVDHIVKAHDGVVEILDSKPNEGSTFQIVFKRMH